MTLGGVQPVTKLAQPAHLDISVSHRTNNLQANHRPLQAIFSDTSGKEGSPFVLSAEDGILPYPKMHFMELILSPLDFLPRA